MYHINKEERDSAIASQGAIEKELFATKGVMQGILAEKEQVEDTLHQARDAGEQLKRQFELALCTSVAERKEYETTVATINSEREAERASSAMRLQSSVEEYQSKIAILTKEYETQLASQQERYESRIAILEDDHASKLQNTIREHETHLSTQKEKYETRLEITIADHESKRAQLSSALAEVHAIRKERETELDRLRLLMRDLEEQHKARESTLLFELASSKKACERLELEKAAAEKKVHKVIEESESMRKVFEEALHEADSVTKMLRDQLEVVRKTMQEQAQASGREIFQLTEELDASQAQTDRIKLAKYRSETSLEEDLAQAQASAEMESLEKTNVSDKLAESIAEGERLRAALAASLKESNVLRTELDTAERRAESIQREAEVRMDAVQREKVHATRQLRDELSQSKNEVNSISREKDLVDVKLRKATDDVSKARYELGSVLKEANALRAERDDTERLLEVMDSRVEEVRKGHGEILTDFDHHYSTLTSTLGKSQAERS
jgi:chromosome segregation ATPase